ncbi:hypothetical protein BH11PSE9_BH11PSE9_08540 [soil metagenome]
MFFRPFMSATAPPGPSPLSFLEPAAPVAARRAGVWQVRLLGGLEARNGEVVLTHFVSHAIGALLARLALHPQRSHPREELVELLWPGVALDVGRNRLRNAISSLKRLLEPPGVVPGSVLAADRQSVKLAPMATRCDALEFERCVREHRAEEARALYRGELLPGFYDDWIQDERTRLAALLDRLVETPREPVPVVAMMAMRDPVPRVEPVRAAAQPAQPPVTPPPRAEHRVFATPPTLPGYLTNSVGREAERAQLAKLVGLHRLVTLSGAGGCGKTRMAVEVASALAQAAAGIDAARATGFDSTRFDTIAFVALADCTSAAQCAAQLRTSLHLPPSAADPLEQAITMLAVGRPLLVLDNFEQLVQSGGLEIVETLLARLPALHLLVTSRRVLGLAGEHELALVPLPQPEADAGLEQVARNASVALFIDRARTVRPDFQVTARNHEAVAALCRALEGLPLAIELAASRSRAFSPADMLAALSERFSLLARNSLRRGAPTLRHDTLHGAIDWSWQLLDARQQRFLRALSVFRGGWSAASAQAVCDEPRAHELLESLTADSLLRSEVDAHGAMRFYMLDMIRAFLRDQLDSAQATALRRQHRAHYLAMALVWQARGALACDEAELPNFDEALRSAVDDGQSELALTLALALRRHWESNGIGPEPLALIERTLDQADPSDSAWAGACIMTALLTLAAGRGAHAQTLAERALAHVDQGVGGGGAIERPALRAAALCALVRIKAHRHLHAEGLMPQLEEAMALAERSGVAEIAAQALSLMGMLVLYELKDAARADALVAEAHARYLAIGMVREASLLRYERASCLMELGRRADALAQAQQLERESAAWGDRHHQLKAINLQGVLYADMRRWAEAIQAYRRCAQLAWQSHNHYWLGFALWNHGRNLARLRQAEPAALLMAFSAAYWQRHFGALDATDNRYRRQVRALVCFQLGAERTATLWSHGESLSLAQAVALSAATLLPGELPPG